MFAVVSVCVDGVDGGSSYASAAGGTGEFATAAVSSTDEFVFCWAASRQRMSGGRGKKSHAQ